MSSLKPVLTLSCADKHGIVAAVAAYLSDQGCNINQSAQYADPDTGLFFMRVAFSLGQGGDLPAIVSGFEKVAGAFQMDWRIRDTALPVRAIVMASKPDHCLVDLLHRTQKGDLNIDIRAVVSNHEEAGNSAAHYKTPFVYAPVTADSKTAKEKDLSALIEDEQVELVVLARYMQILSSDFCAQYAGRIINIHHSFLPSFKGARPYHQAYQRGVKLIGATAHFVTPDLDEGPIIEQEAARVDHAKSPADLVRMGQDVERRTLAQAVRWYSERRVLLNGVKTVIFE